MNVRVLVEDATAIVRTAEAWQRSARDERIAGEPGEREAGRQALALLRRLIPESVRAMNLETRVRQVTR